MLDFLIGFRKFVASTLVLLTVLVVEGVAVYFFVTGRLPGEMLVKTWELSSSLLSAVFVAFVTSNVAEHVITWFQERKK